MSRKTILYIAMSLDGYIADKTGSVNWLEGYGETSEVYMPIGIIMRKMDNQYLIETKKRFLQVVRNLFKTEYGRTD